MRFYEMRGRTRGRPDVGVAVLVLVIQHNALDTVSCLLKVLVLP